MKHHRIRRRHLSIAWGGFAVGAASGMVMGLWSFDGPLANPSLVGDYGALGRRLLRLAHIACFGVGFLHLEWVRQFAPCEARLTSSSLSGWLLIVANIGLPLTLAAAAFVPGLKYTTPLPAAALLVALVLSCRSIMRTSEALP